MEDEDDELMHRAVLHVRQTDDTRYDLRRLVLPPLQG